ncbi:MAG TPA: isoprenyl transferase [Candidatus Tectomicrobia bacterium]|nr:isoprenyl transferase [Candidatus Tectomicrobia bacterium]
MLDPDLLMKIDKGKLPRHIAIVMDGNGRWAKRRFLPRNAGHRAGVAAVDDVVTTARRLGISCLTLYALSTENWSRPWQELRALMGILRIYLRKELKRMVRENIRFKTIGHIQDLPESVRGLLFETMAQTSQNDGMIFTLALSYGSRAEIIDAVKGIAHAVQRGELHPEAITARTFDNYLYTAGLPDPDLLIRTGGELRMSNFLLWQTSYTELYFTEILWPDFRGDDLLRSIIDYQQRERRFGLTTEQILRA